MTDYNKLKVTELKELLKERGIPSTGLSRKNQIVEALEANDVTNGAAPEEEAPEQEEVVAEDVGDAVEDDQDAAPVAPPDEANAPAEEQNVDPSQQVEDVPIEDSTAQEASEPAPQPSVTVMEKNEPVSKEPSAINTPQRASPAAESISSDTRKRKRRSPTPPLSQESVNKKLKAAEEELPQLPEDQVVEEAPAPVPQEPEAVAVEAGPKTIVPSSVSDGVMEVISTLPADVERPRSGSPMDTTAPEEETRDAQSGFPNVMSEESIGPPSTHPSTRALYIRGFVRPLQPQQLRDHLVELATSPPSDTVIKTFHLNTLRTHAFVVFDTLAAAATTRSALHGRIWPDEPARKELWVDFVPEARVQDWIEEEVGSGNRRDAKKWEVVYDTDEEGRVHAIHQEVTFLPPAQGLPRQPSFSTAPAASAPGPGQGMPNAPSGPRADRPSASSQRPPPPERAPSQPKPRAPSNATFDILDQNFNHTTTKPKLYWLPVEKDLADRRLDEIAAQTSRSWEGGRAMRDATAIETQLRRYTYEDGDKLVDNGADIPSFRSEGGRPPGAGRGGRGGGGFRGRR